MREVGGGLAPNPQLPAAASEVTAVEDSLRGQERFQRRCPVRGYPEGQAT